MNSVTEIIYTYPSQSDDLEVEGVAPVKEEGVDVVKEGKVGHIDFVGVAPLFKGVLRKALKLFSNPK